MRGNARTQQSCFAVVTLNELIPDWHPLQAILRMVNRALAGMSGRWEAAYARGGRPSVPPEQLVRALLLQPLYGIGSERQLLARPGYDPSFRWFVGLEAGEEVWAASAFTRNRERLLDADAARVPLLVTMAEAQQKGLLGGDEFRVDRAGR